MSNLLSTAEGLYFEIRGQAVAYLGPASLEGKLLKAFEHLELLFSWFLADMSLPGSDDDALAREFAELIGAEVVVSQRHYEVIWLDEAA